MTITTHEITTGYAFLHLFFLLHPRSLLASCIPTYTLYHSLHYYPHHIPTCVPSALW